MITAMDEKLLSVREAAAMAGTSRPTVTTACANGDIPEAMRIGWQWVIPRDAVLRWMQNRRKIGRPPSGERERTVTA